MGANEAGALPGSREARAKKGGGRTGGKREGGEGNAEGERGGGLINCSTAIRSSLAPGREEGRGRRRRVNAALHSRLPVYQLVRPPPSAVIFHPLHTTSDWYTLHHSPQPSPSLFVSLCTSPFLDICLHNPGQSEVNR